MNYMKTMSDDIKHSINVKFDNTNENFESKFNELNTKLDSSLKNMNNRINEIDSV